MTEQLEKLIELGLSENDALIFLRSITEPAFDAGREYEKSSIRGNIRDGKIGKDGDVDFYDWFDIQTGKRVIGCQYLGEFGQW